MREPKFRAWIPQAKDWINDVDLKDIWKSGQAFEDHGTSRYEAEDIQGVHWKFDDLLFVQYTDLKDKNRREIYEGDLLVVAGGNGPLQVYWDGGAFKTYDGEYRFYLADHNLSEFTIIGNIYENPEMVKNHKI